MGGFFVFMYLLKNCLNCNKEFNVERYRYDIAKYCSTKCNLELVCKKNMKGVHVQCEVCHCVIYQPQSRKRTTCSRICMGVLRSARTKGMTLNSGRTHFKKGVSSWSKGLKLPQFGGENHYKWQSEKPSYRAVHGWMAKNFGSPKYCEHCKSVLEKRYEWANVSREYLRQRSDWIRLCKSCHNIFDETGKKCWETRRGGLQT